MDLFNSPDANPESFLSVVELTKPNKSYCSGILFQVALYLQLSKVHLSPVGILFQVALYQSAT
jgi:hypothetical protein